MKLARSLKSGEGLNTGKSLSATLTSTLLESGRTAGEITQERQAAALREMLDNINESGGTASEAIALARRAAEPPPSENAEYERLSKHAKPPHAAICAAGDSFFSRAFIRGWHGQ